jgi:hypothetical protein
MSARPREDSVDVLGQRREGGQRENGLSFGSIRRIELLELYMSTLLERQEASRRDKAMRDYI